MIRLKTTVIPVVVYFALTTATTLHAQERVRAGMWENTTVSSGQTTKASTCMKLADWAMVNGSPAMARAETEKTLSKSGCTLKDFKIDNSTVTQTIVCGSGTILTETKFLSRDSTESKVTSTSGGVTEAAYVKSRRTGDC